MKPLIIGMSNPYSTDPARALWPEPVGCSGWHLWKMIHEVCGMTAEEYVQLFDRMNLVEGEDWNFRRARRAAKKLVPNLRGREVAVLGRETMRAIGPRGLAPCQSVRHEGATLVYLPHPSGLNRWYNDKLNRWSAGETLAAMVRRSKR